VCVWHPLCMWRNVQKKLFGETRFFMELMEPLSIHRCKSPFLRFHEAYFFMEPQFHKAYFSWNSWNRSMGYALACVVVMAIGALIYRASLPTLHPVHN